MDSAPQPTPPLLKYLNLPTAEPAPHIVKSPVLLRHFVAWRLRKLLFLNKEVGSKSIRYCGCVPMPSQGKRKDGSVFSTGMPGHIEIHGYENTDKIAELGENPGRGHGYVGLKKCGSAMTCPVCGARIRYVRRQEIQEICNVMIKAGYSFGLLTLTAPHDVTTDPQEFIKKFQEANRILKRDKWKEFADKWGIKHYIRGIEVTDDAPGARRRSGIHFHSHQIIFFDRPPLTKAEAEQFRLELAARWVKALLKVELIGEDAVKKTLEHGVDFQRPKVKDQGELSDPGMIQKLVEYVSKGAAFELSPGTVGGKQGRKGSRVSHWELMQTALLEREDLQPRLLNIIGALKGLAHLYFSPGLKAFCGLKEITDEQIVRGEAETLVYAFDTEEKEKTWGTVKRFGQQKILLTALDEGRDAESAVDIIRLGADPISGELLSEPLKLE